MESTIQLTIENKGILYQPEIEGEVTWETERKGAPGKLCFNVIADNNLKIREGNPVMMKWNGYKIFYGFIFTKDKKKETRTIAVVAYDQLRYLKNKDTYVYKKKTLGEVIKMIAKDYNLKTGFVEDTKYKIPKRVEDNQTLFDIILNASDLTLRNKKQMYIMYDDFGKIALKNISDMKVYILVNEETAENYNYQSTIDTQTYNKIKLYRDNKETGKRDVYIAKSTANINSWGVLQYTESLQDGENGKAKADALLKLYNSKTRTLSISKAFGNCSVRAGSMVAVDIGLGDVDLNNWMLVEKCKHYFSDGLHQMDLTLRGGGFD